MILIGIDPGAGDKAKVAFYRDGKLICVMDHDKLTIQAKLRLWWMGYQVRLDDAEHMRPHHGEPRITGQS